MQREFFIKVLSGISALQYKNFYTKFRRNGGKWKQINFGRIMLHKRLTFAILSYRLKYRYIPVDISEPMMIASCLSFLNALHVDDESLLMDLFVAS